MRDSWKTMKGALDGSEYSLLSVTDYGFDEDKATPTAVVEMPVAQQYRRLLSDSCLQRAKVVAKERQAGMRCRKFPAS